MVDELIQHLNNYTQLNPDEASLVREIIPVRSFRKGDILLKEGDISSEFYFIIKGCIRLFYTVNGEEKTAFFYTENHFVSSYRSFVKQAPAHHGLQCVEDITVAVLSIENSNRLLKEYPKFEFLARVIMEEELIIYQDIISHFITLSPEERYLNLLETKPELLQRIPQYHLATYLGITPESLSRIRSRITAKGIS